MTSELYGALLVGSFVVAAGAIWRERSGDRRFAVLVFAPVLVPLVLVVVELVGDLGRLGWLGVALLAFMFVILAVTSRFLLRVGKAGIESKTEAEFEARTTEALVEPSLVYFGLVLFGGLIALVAPDRLRGFSSHRPMRLAPGERCGREDTPARRR